ncbi:MAG: DUF222 domain-containing protein [Propionibacteriales bacterium]|nr:DUF222 domain-containing protein [Propionibacteriales bacterium]
MSSTTSVVKPDRAWLTQLADHLEDLGLQPAETQLTTLDAGIAALQAARAKALTEFESTCGHQAYGCKTIGGWVRLHLNRSHRGGSRLVRTARLLPQLQLVRESYAAGRICSDHVDVFCAGVNKCGLDAVRTHEATLVELAESGSAHELAQALDALADLVDPDRDETAVKQLADRYFHASRVGDLYAVSGLIDPDAGEALQIAVEALAKPVESDTRTRNQRMADAACELITRGINAEHLPTWAAAAHREPHRHPRHPPEPPRLG